MMKYIEDLKMAMNNLGFFLESDERNAIAFGCNDGMKVFGSWNDVREFLWGIF